MHERWFKQDGKLVQQRILDPNPTIERVRREREAPASPLSDSWHIATLPGWLVTIWAKEAGIRFDDPALKDVIKRNLLSGDYSAFRVNKGTY